MTTVTKEFTFDCAHMLDNHKGLCKNLHGHTYKLLVTVKSAGTPIEDNMLGMVLDFSHLKAIVKERIVDRFDHAFIFNIDTSSVCERSIVDSLNTAGLRVVPFGGHATAENMAKYFYDELYSAVLELGCKVVSVQLYETPTSYAIYSGEEAK